MSEPYREHLIRALGLSAKPAASERAHAAHAWAESGLMALTGFAKAPPILAPVPLPHCADDCLDLFREICGTAVLKETSGAGLLTERAAIMGLSRQGNQSPGGSCRLLPATDGVIAINLARDADWELLHPWLQAPCEPQWDAVASVVAQRHVRELVDQGRALGLAIADAGGTAGAIPWCSTRRIARPPAPRGDRPPRVLDLSSLWAGPLCSHLWQQAGAEVTKVESVQRPDGARVGSAAFYQLLNHGKQAVILDLQSTPGRHALRELIADSDIVIESSRPRALQQMDIHAEAILEAQPGLTWVSITGYGRDGDDASRIAYGDDAAVAAGLSQRIHESTDKWVFCGDAIADPLTGLHAAIAGWSNWQRGGGELIGLSLAGTARQCIDATAPVDGDYRKRWCEWQDYLDQNPVAIAAPRARAPRQPC